MLYARRIAHKGLRLLFERGDRKKINPEWVEKIERMLAALNIVTAPSELDLPGFGFHELQGNRKGTFALKVRANWRVTFKWDSEGPYNVNLEDYHGS
jgi:toxin HigB-1